MAPTTLDAQAQPQAPAPDARAVPWVELAFVAAAMLLVAAALSLDLVLTDAYPVGGDLTGHVVVPWVISDDPLAWLPGSWSSAMFNGFPINQLYPVLPNLVVALLAVAVPLSVALKVVVVAPLMALPWAAWQAGRWAALPAPLPVMASLATLPFLFDSSCYSCGGTITATVIGEYSFAWSLLFAVLALGAVDRVARSGRGGVPAALLAAASALSHPLPPLWLLVGVGVIAIGREVWADRPRLVTFALAAASAALMACLWWVPFLATRDWLTPNELIRDGDAVTWLLPATTWWEVAISALAILGLVWAVRRQWWYLLGYAIGAAVAVAAFFAFTDGGPFYSIRVLPFWQLGRWALAAAGFALVVQVVVSRVRSDRGRATSPLVAPTAWLVVATVAIGTTAGWWGVTKAPTPTGAGTASLLGLEVEVPYSATRATFAGFEGRADFRELQSVQQLLRDVGDRRGCGTLLWDNGDPLAPAFGDAQVFWQAAMWTDGCINSADGVLVDSSRTAAAMQATKSLVSQTFEPLVPGTPQYEYNLTLGAPRMRDMGVRYYLTQGGQSAADAEANEFLTLIASAGAWQMWEVDSGVQVADLTRLPAVFEPELNDSEWPSLADRYFTTPTFGEFPLVQTGPAGWPRAGLDAPPASVETKPAGVISVGVSSNTITFEVQNTGVPVVVRASAFPGWTVEGADGPYRATPNYQVVVPTQNQVTLTKGRTPVDWLAIGLAVAGVGLVVLLAVRARRQSAVLAASVEPSDDTVGAAFPETEHTSDTDAGHEGSDAEATTESDSRG